MNLSIFFNRSKFFWPKLYPISGKDEKEKDTKSIVEIMVHLPERLQEATILFPNGTKTRFVMAIAKLFIKLFSAAGMPIEDMFLMSVRFILKYFGDMVIHSALK